MSEIGWTATAFLLLAGVVFVGRSVAGVPPGDDRQVVLATIVGFTGTVAALAFVRSVAVQLRDDLIRGRGRRAAAVAAALVALSIAVAGVVLLAILA